VPELLHASLQTRLLLLGGTHLREERTLLSLGPFLAPGPLVQLLLHASKRSLQRIACCLGLSPLSLLAGEGGGCLGRVASHLLQTPLRVTHTLEVPCCLSKKRLAPLQLATQ